MSHRGSAGEGGGNCMGGGGCLGGSNGRHLLWSLVGSILWRDALRVSAQSMAGHGYTGLLERGLSCMSCASLHSPLKCACIGDCFQSGIIVPLVQRGQSIIGCHSTHA